jgi:hypothetical protein
MALGEADGMQGGKYPTAGRYLRNTGLTDHGSKLSNVERSYRMK